MRLPHVTLMFTLAQIRRPSLCSFDPQALFTSTKTMFTSVHVNPTEYCHVVSAKGRGDTMSRRDHNAHPNSRNLIQYWRESQLPGMIMYLSHDLDRQEQQYEGKSSQV